MLAKHQNDFENVFQLWYENHVGINVLIFTGSRKKKLMQVIPGQTPLTQFFAIKKKKLDFSSSDLQDVVNSGWLCDFAN